MRCEDISTERAAHAHDEEPADDPAILEHLERCPDCAEHESALTPVRDLWRRARESEIEPGDDAWSRLRSRIEVESRPRRRSPLLLAIPAVAAAAAILFFALFVEPELHDALAFEPLYGHVRIDGDPCPAGRTTRLEPGQTVTNGGETPARIDLDGTAFVLSTDAALRLTGGSEFELASGALLVRTSRALAFVSAGARVEVLGTEFGLERTDSGLSVHVLTGHVRLTGAGRTVELPRGTRSFCPVDGAPTAPAGVNPWPALDWIGAPRLHLDLLGEQGDRDGGPIELSIRIDTASREEILLRPFTATSADFLLEIVDPEGRRFPLKILPGMIVEASRPPGHQARFPLVHGHPYRLRIRLEPSDLGDVRGPCTVVASYNVRGPSGERLWQGRLTSETRRIRR